jgi:hypothetical protein
MSIIIQPVTFNTSSNVLYRKMLKQALKKEMLAEVDCWILLVVNRCVKTRVG